MLKRQHDWWSVCFRPSPAWVDLFKPIQTGRASPDQVSLKGGAPGNFQIKSGTKLFRELLHTRLGDTKQRNYPKCFVAESRIQDAGGSCLSFCCLRSFSTLSPSRRSPDGSRTRTPKRTTPACGNSVEAATTSGTVNLSWSSVSIGFKSWIYV